LYKARHLMENFYCKLKQYRAIATRYVTRPSRIAPLEPEVAERVVALTLADPPVEATHWTAAMMAEGFFAKLTRRRLKRGTFHSLVDLQAATNRFVAEQNAAPKPFIWRGHQALDLIHIH
jgi:hypothetical protein